MIKFKCVFCNCRYLSSISDCSCPLCGLGGKEIKEKENNTNDIHEKRKLLVADFINHNKGNVDFIIAESEYKKVNEITTWKERLAYPDYECLDSLYSRVVSHFEMYRGALILYLEKEN